MEARELRIGNYVNVKCIAMEIGFLDDFDACQINIPNLNDISIGSKDFLYEPIPLTEEWLLRFGFYKKQANYELDNFRFHITKPMNYDGFLFCEGYSVITEKIQNVHQLQNLYFALTGEELTLSE